MTTFADRILDGKVAYVAGGTRGMNLAIARRYAQHGARVVVVSRNPERCAEAERVLRDEDGAEALGLPCDVRDYDAVAATFRTAAERFGGVDIVMAGQAGNFYAPITGMSANGFRSVIDIDLVGTFHVWKASWDVLRRPGASLLAITAPEAVRPLHFQAHVCAAKAGVNQLIRVFALEWGGDGVRVNGISPGPIEGSWGMANVASPTPELVEMIRRASPIKRWGTEADIADTALFLASDAASYITGVVLECDGGITVASPETSRYATEADLHKDPRVRRPSK
ncbi:MAG: SDR family oxidoreductase [Alphaproteobacteria bacterium]|nr:SDR family oxidoreductase [Alphaproteobacteria bacterium]